MCLLYLSTFSLGFLWALSELLSRYREIRFILSSLNAWVYLLINALASVIVFYFIPKLDINLGLLTSTNWGKVLLSGLSAMFILRSSFFNYHDKDSNKSINVGVSTILQVFLDSAERKFDQEQSKKSLCAIAEIMKDIDFSKAKKDLSVLCLTLMQNVSPEEQKNLAESIRNISEPQAVEHDLTKSVTLGIILSKITGVTLLKEAVVTLGDEIKFSEEKRDIFNKLEELQKSL